MRRWIRLSLVFCLSLSLFACTQSKKEEVSGFEIVDQSGRKVSFEKPAKTVASGYYIVTSTMIGLGLEDSLVGVEMKAETRNIYLKAAEEIVSLPALGNKKMFNVEECAKINPDVVFLPMGLKDYVKQLEELDIKVVLLNPETQKEYEEAITIIAKVCGVEEKAQAYFTYRDQLLKKYISKDVKEKESVYFAGMNLLEAASEGMYQTQLMQSAKAKNVMSEKDNKWLLISSETLLDRNPSYIFLENGGISVSDVMSQPIYNEVEAVKNNQVYVFPSNLETWDTPNLSSCLGILWMHATLYPQSLSMDDVKKEAKAFYKQFYDIEVSDEEIGF